MHADKPLDQLLPQQHAVEADHSARMGSPLTSHDHRQQPANADGFA